MKKRCGVYSFPKSGNTWMRFVITALFNEKRAIEVVPDIYEHGVNGRPVRTEEGEEWLFYKSHSQKIVERWDGTKIRNDLIIYIMRNPLDVFCSQLNYLLNNFDPERGGLEVGCASVDKARENGLINEYFSAFTVFGTLMPKFLEAGSWMSNTRYWTGAASNNRNIILIRYEKLLENFEEEMEPILDYFGFGESDAMNALKVSNNRTNDGGKFYWKKKQGTYKEYLTETQVSRFVELHRDILSFTGYDKYYLQ